MKTRLRSLLLPLAGLLLPALSLTHSSNAQSPAPAPTPAAGQTWTYTGEAQGVTCGACARMVTAGLKKMPGVTSVKVVLTKQPGVATLEIKSTSPDLNKEAAAKALGPNAETFPVQSLKRETRP